MRLGFVKALTEVASGWLPEGMRWENLFGDLEARFDDLDRAQQEAERADRERVAAGEITAVERIRGAVGYRVFVRTRSGGQLPGELRRVGPDWLLLQESPGRELLVPLASVVAVDGLVRGTGEALSVVESRLGLRHALRGIARDRAPVAVTLVGGTELTGTLDRVGFDFVELATHSPWEVRRAEVVHSVQLLPFGGVDHVRAMPFG